MIVGNWDSDISPEYREAFKSDLARFGHSMTKHVWIAIGSRDITADNFDAWYEHAEIYDPSYLQFERQHPGMTWKVTNCFNVRDKLQIDRGAVVHTLFG